MERVDYDRLASGYDKRYEVNPLAGIGRALRGEAQGRILEVGCGTGRWLSELQGAIGVDRSPGMLSHAKSPVAAADALHLPFRDGAFDFVYCVNALHHFGNRAAYFAEARRVLTRKGSTTVVAIDATRIPAWFMHDYFDGARAIDLARYATLEELACLMEAAGFTRITSREVERAAFHWTKEEVLASPLTGREGNSLLALLPEDVFARGIDRIRAAPPETRFITDMPFFAVTGYLPQL